VSIGCCVGWLVGLVIALRPQTPKHIRGAGHITLTPADVVLKYMVHVDKCACDLNRFAPDDSSLLYLVCLLFEKDASRSKIIDVVAYF
jgi:hypothetical protein